MRSRGLLAVLFAMLMLGGTAGIAAATTPAPTPPSFCFVEKDGALPTCTEGSDGKWTAVYPKGGGNLDDGGTGGGGTKKDVELAISIAALLGIGLIVWSNWIRPRRSPSAPQPQGYAPAMAARVAPGDAGLTSTTPPTVPAAPEPPETSMAQRLADLNALRNQGAIGQDEYEARRQAILSEG